MKHHNRTVPVFVLGSIIQKNQPEGISNSVVEMDEIIMVNH
jgi:hypothetical protein